MKKSALKRIIACLVFCALTAGLIAFANDVLLYKNYNRYYMLRHELERLDEEDLELVVGIMERLLKEK